MEKQFIVLEYTNSFRNKVWKVVKESECGVSLEQAQEIQSYKIKYQNGRLENMRIVKVFDAGVPEIVENQAA